MEPDPGPAADVDSGSNGALESRRRDRRRWRGAWLEVESARATQWPWWESRGFVGDLQLYGEGRMDGRIYGT